MTGGTGDPVPRDAEAVAAALREDPVLLSATMGNGATAAIDAALHAKLDDAVVPVFVVLTSTPPGYADDTADEELVSQVHALLDLDGVYYVHTTQGYGHLGTYGDIDPTVPDDDTSFSLARYSAIEQVYDAVRDAGLDLRAVPAAIEAGVVLDLAALPSVPAGDAAALTTDQVTAYTSSPWTSVVSEVEDEPEPVSPGLGALVGVGVGLVLAVLAYRGLRAWSAAVAGRRRAGADREREVAAAREKARRGVDALDRALAGPDGDVGTEQRELSSRCADTARDLLGSADLLDLVGAQVLVRTGFDALEPGGTPYRCCYLDPRHAPATREQSFGGGLSVPVCRSCDDRLSAGRRPEALSDGERPYYEGDSVWARTGYGATTDVLWVDVQRERAR